MIEPGIYDDVCTKVREETKADGVLLIVINGEAGSGVSSQLKGKVMQAIPSLLRDMADKLEKDIFKIVQENFNG